MKNRSAILLGSILIVVGIFSLIDIFFNVNLWSLLFPLLIIAIGVFILIKPKTLSGRSEFIVRFTNEKEEVHPWTIKTAEYLSFVTDIKWDLTKASIPDGETLVRYNSFVNEVKIILPENAGVKISARGIVHDTKVMGQKEDHIFAPFEYETPDYNLQTKRVFLQLLAFVSEVEIDKPG